MLQPPPPMPYSKTKPVLKRRPVQIGLVLAVIAGGYFAFHGGSDKGPKGPAPVNIKVDTVKRQAVPLTVEAVGTVVAHETVAVRSRLDSQVVKVHFKDGDEVNKGALLFELDDSTLRAQALQLAANVARDKAQLQNAKYQQERAAALAAKGFASKATRDDTEANAQAAIATVQADTAALENVNAQLAYTRIVAPISGRTGTINVTLGNTVKANDTTPLVTINQLKPIRVQASLPQNMFDAVREAMNQGPVTVNVRKQDDDSNTTLAQGTLEYIDNGVDQSTGTFATRAGFANEDERLWPGMFVTMTMNLGEDKNAITIPEVAVQHGQTGDFVYVIADDKAARRDIKVARLQSGIAVIATGLQDNEVVATDGILGLKDGSAVTLKAKDASKGDKKSNADGKDKPADAAPAPAAANSPEAAPAANPSAPASASSPKLPAPPASAAETKQ